MREKQRQMLLDLRSQLVGKLHTQPFTIYNDATIEALLDAQPKTIKELSRVKGFPENGKRVKGFGETVIKIFTDCASIDSFEISGEGEELSVGAVLTPMTAF